MAKEKKTAEQKIKENLKADFEKTTGTADLLTGQREIGGKLGKGKYVNKQEGTKQADFDDFCRTIEQLPFDKLLGQVKVTRLTKGQTTNK